MDKIISSNLPVVREEVRREESKARIEKIGERFKLEILHSIKSEPSTIYSLGEEWWDLCGGPHVESTGQLPKKSNPFQVLIGGETRRERCSNKSTPQHGIPTP